MSCWQIPEDTFRGLVEPMPRQVRAVLTEEGIYTTLSTCFLILWLMCTYCIHIQGQVTMYMYTHYRSVKVKNKNTRTNLYADRTVQGCCNGKVTREMTQYVCGADRDSRCVVGRKLVYYCMIERGRAKKTARER